MLTIQQLREDIAARAKQVRDLLDANPGNKWTADHQAKYDEHMTAIENNKAEIQRHEAVMAALKEDAITEHLGKHAGSPDQKKAKSAALFAKWLRGGDKALSAQDWTDIRNTMSTTTGSQGGYTVQSEIVADVMDALKAYGGVRAVATVIQTEQGNPLSYPTSDGTSETGELVAENAAAADADISFGTAALTAYRFSSKVVTVPYELLQDAVIDIAGFVNSRLATRLGRITNTYFTTGTGSSQPKGVVTAAGAGKVGASGQTATIIYDDLIDLIHSVDPAYRESGQCAFMMNDASIKIIRKLKDSNGRPLFQPDDSGLVEGFAGVILGYKVIANQDMAVMAASAKSIIFGDFSKYIIRDVMGATMHRFDDSAYAKNGQVGFLAFTRHGGNFCDVGNSLKYYQNAAS